MKHNAQQKPIATMDVPSLSLFVISGAVFGDDSDTVHVIAAEAVGVAIDAFKRRLLDGVFGADSEDLNNPNNPELIIVNTEQIGSLIGTNVLILEREYRPALPAAANSRLAAEQVEALQLINVALSVATNSGLFDELLAHCKSPDSINDLCDAVAELATGGLVASPPEFSVAPAKCSASSTCKAIDPRIGKLNSGQFYACTNGYDKPEFVGTLEEVEAALGLPVRVPKKADTAPLKMWNVVVRFQYPSWDEVDGLLYEGICAASKADANKIVRRRASDDGHTIGRRTWLTATEASE